MIFQKKKKRLENLTRLTAFNLLKALAKITHKWDVVDYYWFSKNLKSWFPIKLIKNFVCTAVAHYHNKQGKNKEIRHFKSSSFILY